MPEGAELGADTGTEVATDQTENATVTDPAGTDEGTTTEPVTGTESTDGASAGEGEGAVDWAGRVTEWGGEEEIKGAIALQDALRTREGVAALFQEAANALGIGEKAAALFGGADTEQSETESPEDLLADPDRVLTAGEVARLMEHQRQQDQRQQDQAQHAASVRSSIDSVFSELGIVDQDRDVVFALADKLHGDAAVTPESAAAAIRRANETFNAQVVAAAQKIITDKAKANAGLPKLPPSGGSSGSAQADEPRNLEEAKKRVRANLGQ